jgi:Glycosyl-hydrolase family 116, catalytic region
MIGSCHGTCQHVWNYAQAMAHLFPALERGLRETEHEVCMDQRGHQEFRTPLPIRTPPNTFHPAADGQLGGVIKVYREWRISGSRDWLARMWPNVRRSLDFAIATWDPRRSGALEASQHNTYDIEFWGPNGMLTSFFASALDAAVSMGGALGDEVGAYVELRDKAILRLEGELFDGEYFVQKDHVQNFKGASAQRSPKSQPSPEARALLESEGPKYQYGTGCLSDGVLGFWIAACAGLPEIVDAKKIESHLLAVYRHNFRTDLTGHANPQRPRYALPPEGGLLLCTWPKGGALTLPFPYSNEVWTGIEYQVACHLISFGRVNQGLAIVRAARKRYDGEHRNPFDEYECGRWYARALASYGLFAALSGARYDAVERVLHLRPKLVGDFESFLCTATGYGTVGVRDGNPFLDVVEGEIHVERIEYAPFVPPA